MLGLPPAFWLDPNNPTNTGIALARDAGGYDEDVVSPTVHAGHRRLHGASSAPPACSPTSRASTSRATTRSSSATPNWPGNGDPRCAVSAANCRPNTAFNQINFYTNQGRSEYKAFVTSLNGTLKGGHVVTASWTVADKKNINDDFSPALTDYPNDPADIEAEWGRSRADERYRFVASAVFRLPYSFTVAPIFEYGSGQPWNRRRGYDYNGDGKSSRSAAGGRQVLGRRARTSPRSNLRVTYRPARSGPQAGSISSRKRSTCSTGPTTTPNSVQTGECLSGPTLQNPNLPLVAQPAVPAVHGHAAAARVQLGIRFTF